MAQRLGALGEFIAQSKIMHVRWYERASGQRFRNEQAAIQHLVDEGLAKGLSPHPLFDPVFYLNVYRDVAEAGMSPLDHYINSGGREGRAPSGFFRIERYVQKYNYEIADTFSRTALEHFVRSSCSASELFFFDKAQSNNEVVDFLIDDIPKGSVPHPVVREGSIPASKSGLSSYRKLANLLDPTLAVPQRMLHPSFDIRVAEAHAEQGDGEAPINGLRDFFEFGSEAGRWFHPLVDPSTFPAAEVEEAGDAFRWYIVNRKRVEENPNAYLDGAYYRRLHGAEMADGETPTSHYMKNGFQWPFEPSERFGQRYYLRQRGVEATPGWPALADWLHRTRRKGVSSLPAKPLLFPRANLTSDELAAEITRLAQATSGSRKSVPDVTVVVPAFGEITVTLQCVRSLFEAETITPFTVHVVDDCSPGGEGAVLEQLLADAPGIEVSVNSSNLGFLRSCNETAKGLNTPYIAFLNNDTLVTDHWLDRLYVDLQENPNVGLVGPKLVYPNGLLQEAGAIVWSKSAANFGRMDDPNAPEYRYRRHADYISGAAILLPREVWEQVGGFSEEFAPAYYEDTDLAMKVRSIGRDVIYQPSSTVVHIEGATSGTDILSGVKRYQAINREKFLEKWETELSDMGSHGDFSRRILSRQQRGRILFIDADLPTPDKDSGSITAVLVMKTLVSMGFHVTFVPENLYWEGPYVSQLEALGIEVLGRPYINNLDDFILDNGNEFDLFWVARAPTAKRYVPMLKHLYADTPVVFDTVDLHYLRMKRDAEAGGATSMSDALAMRESELNTIRAADASILVSSYEEEVVRSEIGPFPCVRLPLVYEAYLPRSSFAERSGVAFVGGFRHPPNIDAVHWLVEEIWPRCLDLGFDSKLHIIGSHMPDEIRKMASATINVAGFVPNLEEYFETMRLSVAPLRVGAGVKGKVGNSLRMGVPVVGTPMALEGMGMTSGEHALEAPNASVFAENIIRLHTDENLWTQLSKQGSAFAEANFSEGAAQKTLGRLLDSLL